MHQRPGPHPNIPARSRIFQEVVMDITGGPGRSRQRSPAMNTRKLWNDYGLSITLVAMFLVAWGLQTWTGWVEFVGEQAQHGQTAQAFGNDGYVWGWMQSTFENWQSEFLQVFVFIVLTTFLVHRNSHESPDTDYDSEASLRRIEAKIDALERRLEQR
jgi:hypothetical protein